MKQVRVVFQVEKEDRRVPRARKKEKAFFHERQRQQQGHILEKSFEAAAAAARGSLEKAFGETSLPSSPAVCAFGDLL